MLRLRQRSILTIGHNVGVPLHGAWFLCIEAMAIQVCSWNIYSCVLALALGESKPINHGVGLLTLSLRQVLRVVWLLFWLQICKILFQIVKMLGAVAVQIHMLLVVVVLMNCYLDLWGVSFEKCLVELLILTRKILIGDSKLDGFNFLMGVLVWIFNVVTKGFQILRRRCWIFIILDLDVEVKIQILIPCYISPRIQTCICRTSIMWQFLWNHISLIKCRLASFIVHHLHKLLFLCLFKVLLQELFFCFLGTCLLDYDWALFCISAKVIGLWHLIQNWVQ